MLRVYFVSYLVLIYMCSIIVEMILYDENICYLNIFEIHYLEFLFCFFYTHLCLY